MGLSHPNDDGFDNDYSVEDTIMSYNNDKLIKIEWFTEVDLYALKQIWGEESNLIYPLIIGPSGKSGDEISSISIEENNITIYILRVYNL